MSSESVSNPPGLDVRAPARLSARNPLAIHIETLRSGPQDRGPHGHPIFPQPSPNNPSFTSESPQFQLASPSSPKNHFRTHPGPALPSFNRPTDTASHDPAVTLRPIWANTGLRFLHNPGLTAPAMFGSKREAGRLMQRQGWTIGLVTGGYSHRPAFGPGFDARLDDGSRGDLFPPASPHVAITIRRASGPSQQRI